jgi:hypothetical protein
LDRHPKDFSSLKVFSNYLRPKAEKWTGLFLLKAQSEMRLGFQMEYGTLKT